MYTIDSDESQPPPKKSPCQSPTEALAVAIDAARDSQPQASKRSQWWRHHWLRQLAKDHRLVAVARRHNVHPGTIIRYLQTVADYTNRSGTDPVYCLRSTLADRLEVSIATIGRARAAAVELGYHTRGEQLRWLNDQKPGTDPWCGGPSVVLLTMPDVASIAEDPRAEAAAQRIAARRAARAAEALEAKRQADERHRAWVESLIIDVDAIERRIEPKELPESAAKALKAARASLSPP